MKQNRPDPKYAAQTILARRDHSEAEMRAKLSRKKFSRIEIEETVAWLRTQHLINDEEYARSYIESTLSMKAVGPRWLSFKLKQKGLSSDLISSALHENYSLDREKEQATHAKEQWQTSHAKHQNDRQRMMRFLMSRGFSSGCISEILDN